MTGAGCADELAVLPEAERVAIRVEQDGEGLRLLPLLLVVTFVSSAAVGTWVGVPSAHLVKHVSDLPDTLHPNTYVSILMLAAFTFVVATIGLGGGIVGR